ncbi:DUF5518 domain-containing protein [uncultured Methanoregula sp.]|uniref:DUF5518 domain-containing protein n=1 Tax=uncultured Methanoregula sp. TaxID=1005933 RepID=UPI002AABBA8C|nr:hypothetical protein [uncultured Methanoregula sp.]
MWFELLALIFGAAFGFFHRGKEDYKGLLRNGAITGIVTGIIFVLLTLFLVPGGMGIDVSFLGVFGFVIVIVIFVLIFIVGAFLGDWLERILKK